MGTVPTAPRSDFLQWCNTHAPIFTANAAEIGLTPAQATAFSNGTGSMGSLFTEQDAARQAAMTATTAANDQFTAMKTMAGEVVKAIKAFATNSGDPNAVYALAGINPPAPPSPSAPPGQPTNLTVSLAPQDGWLSLAWKCVNPPNVGGTSYFVQRKLPSETEWKFLGVATKKEFVDQTFYAGPDSVQYTVQAVRSGILGEKSQIFTVTFGIAPGGQTVARVSTSPGRGMPLNVTASGPSNGNGDPAAAPKGRMAAKH